MLLGIPAFTDNDFNFHQNLMHWWEIILTPIYFLILIKLGKWCFKKINIPDADKKLFFSGLKVRMLGALFITIIYNSYYIGGDTSGYFNDGRLLGKTLFADPAIALRMFLSPGGVDSWPDDLQSFVSNFRMVYAANSWMVVKFSAFFSLFCFQSMLCTALCFAFFSYLCSWKFYSTISQMYPHVKSKLAIVCLFVPSINIWGSAIFKDTITLSAMLILFCSVYQLFFKKKSIFKNILIIIIAAYLLGVIKNYLLISFSLSLYIWLLISLGFAVKNKLMRITFLIFISLITLGSSFLIIDYLGKEIKGFALEDILEKSVATGKYLQGASEKEEGSTYNIGEIEPTVQGFIAIAPKAINVTLFRPYLWEANKIIILFAAIESTLIFIYFIWVLLKNKIIFFFYKIFKDPFLFLCIIFTLIIATFVGVSSFNFGTLVRYKIPCIPFFLTALVIISNNKKQRV